MSERATDSFQDWLRERVPERGLRPKAAALLEVLLSQPRRASFASAAELAQLAGVNVADRDPHRAGAGLRRVARAASRSCAPATCPRSSAPQVAAEHSGEGSPSSRSLRRDLDSLALLNRRLDERRAAYHRRGRRRRGPHRDRRGRQLRGGRHGAARDAGLAGYPVAAVTSGDAELANSVAAIGPGDVLIAISFWRLYESTVLAANEARARGVRVFALTDAASPALANAAEEVVMVPAEGVAFFPSLTAGMAVAQALVTQLATVDPARTSASIETAEGMWSKFGLLHRRPAPRPRRPTQRPPQRPTRLTGDGPRDYAADRLARQQEERAEVEEARPRSAAPGSRSTSARYSRQPPTMAPSRFAPKAVVASAESAKRLAKTTLAAKIGRNATVTAATARSGSGSRQQPRVGHQPGQQQRRRTARRTSTGSGGVRTAAGHLDGGEHRDAAPRRTRSR